MFTTKKKYQTILLENEELKAKLQELESKEKRQKATIQTFIKDLTNQLFLSLYLKLEELESDMFEHIHLETTFCSLVLHKKKLPKSKIQKSPRTLK